MWTLQFFPKELSGSLVLRTKLVHEATNLLPDGIESINHSLKSIIPNVWLIFKIKLFGLISSN